MVSRAGWRIYCWPTGLTGPYINVTMSDDAGVDLSGACATSDDWAAALAEVQETLGLDAAMALDPTAHRPYAGTDNRQRLLAETQIDTGQSNLEDDQFRKALGTIRPPA